MQGTTGFDDVTDEVYILSTSHCAHKLFFMYFFLCTFLCIIVERKVDPFDSHFG